LEKHQRLRGVYEVFRKNEWSWFELEMALSRKL
jgi:hypothetical protein